MSGLVDNIRASLLGLKMPRALEMLDHTIQRLEKGELGAIEAIDGLLSEEFPAFQREVQHSPNPLW